MGANKWAPCETKYCSFCCDPVGIITRLQPNVSKIKDISGKEIWKYIGMRLPKECPDSTKIWLYECLLFNKKTGKCNDYENRPDVCRNTTCIDSKSAKSIDEQHTEFIDEHKDI